MKLSIKSILSVALSLTLALCLVGCIGQTNEHSSENGVSGSAETNEGNSLSDVLSSIDASNRFMCASLFSGNDSSVYLVGILKSLDGIECYKITRYSSGTYASAALVDSNIPSSAKLDAALQEESGLPSIRQGETAYAAIVLNQIDDSLIDPESAQYSDVEVYPVMEDYPGGDDNGLINNFAPFDNLPGMCVFLEVNAKNRLGGYVGRESAFYLIGADGNATVIDPTTSYHFDYLDMLDEFKERMESSYPYLYNTFTPDELK